MQMEVTAVEILYERNYYTLTWNTGENASYIAPEQVRYGAAVTKPDKNPTKVGYEFKGWENLSGDHAGRRSGSYCEMGSSKES